MRTLLIAQLSEVRIGGSRFDDALSAAARRRLSGLLVLAYATGELP
jgi:hypothetical protein